MADGAAAGSAAPRAGEPVQVTVWRGATRNPDRLADRTGRQKNAARRRRFQKSRRVALSVLYETDLFHARVLGVRQHPGQHAVIGVRVGVDLQHPLGGGSRAVTMKMISNTSITSTRGVTLMSAIAPPPELEVKAMSASPVSVL